MKRSEWSEWVCYTACGLVFAVLCYYAIASSQRARVDTARQVRIEKMLIDLTDRTYFHGVDQSPLSPPKLFDYPPIPAANLPTQPVEDK